MRRFYRDAGGYEEQVAGHASHYFRRYLATWRSHLPARSGTVVEIGAGAASALTELVRERRVERLIAVDLASRTLRGVARRGRRIHAVCGDALDLPLDDGSVDVVTSFQVIEHLPAVGRALEEALRVLRRPGYLVIGMPNHASLLTPIEDMVRGTKRGAFAVHSRIGAGRWWLRNLRLCARKRLARGPRYLYRTPDLGPESTGGDRDAVYYASPLDVLRDLATRGVSFVGSDATVRWGRFGRWVPPELRGSMIGVWRTG